MSVTTFDTVTVAQLVVPISKIVRPSSNLWQPANSLLLDIEHSTEHDAFAPQVGAAYWLSHCMPCIPPMTWTIWSIIDFRYIVGSSARRGCVCKRQPAQCGTQTSSGDQKRHRWACKKSLWRRTHFIRFLTCPCNVLRFCSSSALTQALTRMSSRSFQYPTWTSMLCSVSCCQFFLLCVCLSVHLSVCLSIWPCLSSCFYLCVSPVHHSPAACHAV